MSGGRGTLMRQTVDVDEGGTMSEQGYQGWANYPTWAMNLWLSNDEGLYYAAMQITEDAVAGRTGADDFALAEIRSDVADALKEYVTQDLAPDLGATFAADLLGYALGEVDWYELGQAWLENVGEAVSS